MKVSLQEFAYNECKALIESGELSPDNLYSEVALSKQLGVSRTPMRTALQNLEKDGVPISHGYKVGIGTLAACALMETIFAKDINRADIAAAYDKYPSLEEREKQVEQPVAAVPCECRERNKILKSKRRGALFEQRQDAALGFDFSHLLMTIFAYLIFISVCVFLYNAYISYKKGEDAPGNVWRSRSPEWLAPSPMPVHNYEKPLEVVGNPYDYSKPGSTYVKFIDK